MATTIIRIMEGTRVVAEATLEVYDREQAQVNFMEALPQAVGMMQGAIIGAVIHACAGLETPFVGLDVKGNHTGLELPGIQIPPAFRK